MSSSSGKSSFLNAMMGFLCLLALAGCSQKQESSSLTITFPNWKELESKHAAQVASSKGFSADGESASAQAIQSVVTRVMINVTSSDMKVPYVYIWDMNSQIKDSSNGSSDSTLPVAPKEVTFELKRGVSATFQALAIVESIDTDDLERESGSMTFYYGDATKAISGDSSSDAVSLSLASQGTSTGQGTVSGRYLNADGTTPTGKINMYFAPSGNKPEMIVDQSQTMFSGFFRIFMPTNVQFSYRLASGQALFERVNTTTFPMTPNSSAAVKIQIPAGYRERGNGTRVPTQARTKIAGFFGTTASTISTRVTCYPGADSAISGLYPDSSTGTPMAWVPGSSSTTVARVLQGGAPDSPGTCSSGELGVQQFTIAASNLSSGDSLLGIRGPFREIETGNDNYVTFGYSTGGPSISWKYLRPTLGNSVAGVGIFTYEIPVGGSNPANDNDGLSCTTLSKLGFAELSRVPYGSTSSPVESYDLNTVKQASVTTGRFVVAVCPYSPAGSYYDAGILYRIPQSIGSATQIKARVLTASEVPSTAAARQNYAVEICTPIQIRTLDASGNLAYRSTSNGVTPQLTVSLASGAGKFYDNPYCSTGDVSSLQLSMWSPERVIYIKAGNAIPNNINIAVADTTSGGAALPSVTAYLAAVPRATPSNRLRVVTATSSIQAHQCYPISFVRGIASLADHTDFVPQGGSSANATFVTNITNFPGLSFHSSGDSNCTESGPSGAYFSGMESSTVPMYFKYTGTQNAIAINPDGSSYSMTTIPRALVVTQPGPVVKAAFFMTNSLPAEQCTPIRLQLLDSQNRPNALGGGGVFQATVSAGTTFYSDSSCSTATSGDVTIAVGQSLSNAVYARWMSPSSVMVTATVTSTPSLPISPLNVTVSSAQVSFITARVAGVNYVHPSGYSGTGAQGILGGQFNDAGVFNMTFEARSSFGNLVAGFSEMDLGPSGMGLTTLSATGVSCATPSWNASGVGTAQCILSDANVTDYVGFSTGGASSRYNPHTTPVQFFASRSAATQTTAFYTRIGGYGPATCYPLLFTRRHSQYATIATAAITRNLSAPPAGNSGYFLDPACTMATTTATIPAKSSAGIFYIRTDGPGPGSPQLDSTALYDPVALQVASLNPSTPSSVTQFRMVMTQMSRIGVCEPLMIMQADVGGVPIPAATAFTATVSSPNAEIYASGDCSGTSSTSVNFGAGVSTKLVFVKMVSSGTVTVNVDNGGIAGSATANVAGMP